MEKCLKTCYVLVYILKIKWLFSYRINYSLVTRIYGALGAHVTRENYKNIVQFGPVWCIFDQMVF